jgi:hypothetical protein
MCLYIHSRKVEKQIALSDFKVGKIIYEDNTSFVQGFLYKPNQTYHLNKSLVPNRFDGFMMTIHEGFHGWLPESLLMSCDNVLKWMATRSGKVKLVEMIVPKNASYYFGINDDIVTDTIRTASLDPLDLRAIRAKELTKEREEQWNRRKTWWS